MNTCLLSNLELYRLLNEVNLSFILITHIKCIINALYSSQKSISNFKILFCSFPDFDRLNQEGVQLYPIFKIL